MQFLNNLVEDNKYTVPNIQNIIEQTQGKRFFTVIDLTDGYYQIKLKKSIDIKQRFILIISCINGQECHKGSKIHLAYFK